MFSVEYYHSNVLADVESWPVDVLADYARLVELLVEHGPDLRLPYSRSMGQGLFELRPHGRSGAGRAMYCFVVGKRIVVVHAFLKKTRQTPDSDLKIARRRIKELRNG
ncbi:MAG: type II toxin-antitoxin system RelE/ParE family toxin [Rhodocyclaceae bacterium]|jgi:phage-related protein|nr:type II toxin-antitoxin system RelE/ParE family toxin [Rhodocyclaceae bacterium]MCA3644132.1 type II toxin-antitoxin system RelE/ParE family toxin [Methylobacterium sp.]MCA3075513.1 type II toxin-antitoxin system RelE/ParE family toxin [Rhodocyclaceae bacterium]MCA3104180.1 type II toxin-antitoxin system RelE/ParE family toxin [Rhodocyclaceae bacterium]MCA3111587.1 type II toxin-antitoxin system RelE/ParE family toxin [Rhodocyclaceae bacterium]